MHKWVLLIVLKKSRVCVCDKTGILLEYTLVPVLLGLVFRQCQGNSLIHNCGNADDRCSVLYSCFFFFSSLHWKLETLCWKTKTVEHPYAQFYASQVVADQAYLCFFFSKEVLLGSNSMIESALVVSKIAWAQILPTSSAFFWLVANSTHVLLTTNGKTQIGSLLKHFQSCYIALNNLDSLSVVATWRLNIDLVPLNFWFRILSTWVGPSSAVNWQLGWAVWKQ